MFYLALTQRRQIALVPYVRIFFGVLRDLIIQDDLVYF